MHVNTKQAKDLDAALNLDADLEDGDDLMLVALNPCPICGGDPVPLGTLGFKQWLRCRQCGCDYARN